MKKLFAAGLILLVALSVVFAGTGTVAYVTLGNTKKITYSWGNSAASTTGCYDVSCVVTSDFRYGVLERVVFHAASASTGAAYDVTLTDDDGIDMLNGGGSAIATGATSITWCPGVVLSNGTYYGIQPYAFNTKLRCAVTNFAWTNAIKTGSMSLYYHE